MLTASLVFGLVLASAIFTATRPWWKSKGAAIRAFVAVFIVSGLTGLVLNAEHYAEHFSEPAGGAPQKVLADGYLSSDNCRSCHVQEYETWHSSYHRTMSQLASRNAVLAPFDGREFTLGAKTYRPFMKQGEFWFELDEVDRHGGASGKRVQYKIVQTTGSHHMQVYWRDAGDGQLNLVPVAYLLKERRWIPRSAAFVSPTACAVDASDGSTNGAWNKVCIECHATHGRPRLRSDGGLESRVVDFGISCESCHGPAKQHAQHFANPLRRYFARSDQGQNRTTAPGSKITNPKKLDKHRSAETCGQCHSVRMPNNQELVEAWNISGHRYRPGDKLEDTLTVMSPSKVGHPLMTTLETSIPGFTKNTFWSDGMIRVTGREFNSLSNTKCFINGELTCVSCHSMHAKESANGNRFTLANFSQRKQDWRDDQLAIGMRSNQACVGCHDSIARDVPQHTHHAAKSTGSNCYNCHMPHTTYGLLKSVRSHQIDSPNAATTLKTGRPNACNLCHLDQPLGWTAEKLSEWYDQPTIDLEPDRQQVADSLYALFTGDAAQRALAVAALGREDAMKASNAGQWAAPFLAHRLDDPYRAVRLVALRSLRRQPGFADFDYDFIGSAEKMEKAKRRAMSIWREHRAAQWRSPGTVLTDQDGRLQLNQIERLDAQRDDSEVSLVE